MLEINSKTIGRHARHIDFKDVIVKILQRDERPEYFIGQVVSGLFNCPHEPDTFARQSYKLLPEDYRP